ncbi:hypothetical protein I203_105242 [Kwoniella mangroviensis CBS 8507]|uniref:uncharacterized protein n=1 Tax=Kwoniella mangroviensis CBS 8507 TaxID=1296122 RepID=UPI00080D6576|nr:uncharacterized protein I203_01061 [Kwoniella mangroviensis CBS 8507]OCF69207.1 hypothetical protein I203_01061 [Kwoniella mangroviensis CBS 8507]
MLRSQTAAGSQPIKQPGPYDLFPRPAVASWLDGIQAKIQQGLNPPESPGPSESPSPILRDSIEVEDVEEKEEEDVQDPTVDIVQNGLSSVDQHQDYDETDEFGEEFDEDEELEAAYHEDEDIPGEQEYDDQEVESDGDIQEIVSSPEQLEPLFQTYDEEEGEEEEEDEEAEEDGVEENGQNVQIVQEGYEEQDQDEDELFESRSQSEYDPAYGVVPEEDGAAYVGSDGDVYGDEDQEEEDEDEEDEHQDEEEQEDDDDEEEAEEEEQVEQSHGEEDEESDDGIEYMGTSESPAPKSDPHQYASPPNTLYPTLPLPPPPTSFVESGQTPQSEEQISQLPPFSEDAIDPSLLAQIVQQVHNNMPEDDAGPSIFGGNAVSYQPQSSTYQDLLPIHDVFQQPSTAYGSGYGEQDEEEQDQDEIASEGQEEEDEEDELGDEEDSEGSYDDQEEEQVDTTKRPVFTEVIEIGSSSDEDEDNEEEEEEEEQVEEDQDEGEDEGEGDEEEEEEEEEEEIEYVEDRNHQSGRGDERYEVRQQAEGPSADRQEDEKEEEAEATVFEANDVILNEFSEEVSENFDETQKPPEEAIMYDGEVIEDRHSVPSEVQEPSYVQSEAVTPSSILPMEMEVIEVVEVTEVQATGNANIITEPETVIIPSILEPIISEVIDQAQIPVDEHVSQPEDLSTPKEDAIESQQEDLATPQLTDEFTMDVDEPPIKDGNLEEANFSPFDTPTASNPLEPFHAEEFVAFDSVEAVETSDGPSVVNTPTVETAGTESMTVSTGPDSQTTIPAVLDVQQPLSEFSPSLVEPPGHLPPGEIVAPAEELSAETPTDLPDPKLSPPDANIAMPFIPHDLRPSIDRSPSLAVEPPERDPVPGDVPTAAASRSSTPVSLPDPTVPPPNTSARQPLDIHTMVPQDHVTPSLVVEIPQNPVPADITSAISSRAATPPALPDPGLPPADTLVTGPLDPHDLVPHPPSSPSLIVEPPGKDPIPSDILSAPGTRAATPMELPDPALPPPDSYLLAPITPHQLIPSEYPQTPSLQVEAATDSPAQTMSRNPSALGSFVQFSSSDGDVDVMSEGDDDIQVHVRWIEPETSTQDITTNMEEQVEASEGNEVEDLSIQAEAAEMESEEQYSLPSASGEEKEAIKAAKETSETALSGEESPSEDDIQVDVQQLSSDQQMDRPEEAEEPLPSNDNEADRTAETPLESIQNGLEPTSSTMLVEERKPVLSTNEERSEEEATETGSPQKEKPPFLPQVSESTIMRLFHRHGSPSNASVPGPETTAHRRTRSRGRASTSLEPPTTRSHCYYEKLRVSDDDLTAVVLVPHCAIPGSTQLEQETSHVEGRSSESEETEGRNLQMDHDHPILLPQLTTKIRRLVGNQLVDEGHCYVLYAKDDAKVPEIEENGTPKGTPLRGHRKRKSMGGSASRNSTGGDDEDSTVLIKVESYETPSKKRATLSPPATRSGRKRGTASASVEPESEVGATPARRGRGGRPSNSRKGKGRESSVTSDTGSRKSNTASPGPALRKSARMSIARGENIPELEEGTPVPAEDELNGKSVTASPGPQLEGSESQSPTKAKPRRSTRMSSRGKQDASTATPEPQAEDQADTEVDDTSRSELATPSGSTRLKSPRKTISSASKADEAPYRPESEEDDDDTEEEQGGDDKPPSSARSTLSVEIPSSKKRKSRASEAQNTNEEDLKDDSAPAASTRKRKARAASKEPDLIANPDETTVDQGETPMRETRGMKRRAIESKLVPGTPVPEPDTTGEEGENDDIQVKAETSPTSSARTSSRSGGWSGRLMKKFGWGR